MRRTRAWRCSYVLRNSGRASVIRSVVERVLKLAHPGSISKVENSQFSGLAVDGMGVLDFDLIAVIVHDTEIELQSVRFTRHHEAPASQYPIVVVILDSRTDGVAASIRGNVESPIFDCGQVHELCTDIVTKHVVVKHIGDRHLADSQHQTSFVDRAGELVRCRFDMVRTTAH